jgi:hypothetical protein
MTYSVVFNKTTLNADGLLSPNISNNTFIVNLIQVAARLSAATQSFYGYSINGSATIPDMIDRINAGN